MAQENEEMVGLCSQDKSELMETDNTVDNNKDALKPAFTQLKAYLEKGDETQTEAFNHHLPMQDLIYNPEYSEQILMAWIQLESMSCYSLSPDFLSNTNIPAATFKNMRVTLMDWLISIQLYLNLSNEALQLTINIADRFTAASPSCVGKCNYQLIGLAALSISSKFEEVAHPDFKLLCDLSENAYTKQKLAEMEKQIYFTLDCKVSNPQPIHFLRFFSILLSRDQGEHTLAKYFLELSLLQAEAAHLRPSIRATICLSLASQLLTKNYDVMWKLSQLLNIERQVLEECERTLVTEVRRVTKQKGGGLFVCQKYAEKKFNQVSTHSCLSQI